jgi:chromate reductase, NAD(P)H dehydrogenase (quinone)
MANPKDIAVFVGSLRKESFTRKVALALGPIAPPTLKLSMVEIGPLAPYNQDLDANPPAEWVALKQRIKKADAILFVTPEYNRSVPGFLKNTIDIASRPYGHSAWDDKPAAVISVSPGAIGGFGANHHLRQSLVFLNMPTMTQPEAYIGGAANLVDDKGELTVQSTKEFLSKFLVAFDRWIDRNQPPH